MKCWLTSFLGGDIFLIFSLMSFEVVGSLPLQIVKAGCSNSSMKPNFGLGFAASFSVSGQSELSTFCGSGIGEMVFVYSFQYAAGRSPWRHVSHF